MAQQNWWENDAVAPAATPGVIPIGGPDPSLPLERQILSNRINAAPDGAALRRERIRAAKNANDLATVQLEAARRKQGMLGSRAMAPQEMAYLNSVRPISDASVAVMDQLQKAAAAIGRSGLTPSRAAIVQSATPTEDAGPIGALGANFRKFMGGVSDTEISDFQYLQGLQNRLVLDAQQQQKGPQTESDAARLKLSQISPFKAPAANAELIGDGVLMARLGSRKTPFYTEWANKYGLNGLDEQGRSVDRVWYDIMADAQGNLATQRQNRGAGHPGLSAADLNEYQRLVESGADAEQLQTFFLNKTGGRGRLDNANEIAGAAFVPGISDQQVVNGVKIRRVK